MVAIALFFGGRIVTSDINRQVDQLLKIKEKNPDITFFVSLNKEVDNVAHTKEFCERLNIQDECVQVHETREPESLYKYTHGTPSYQRTYSMFFHNKMCMESIKRYQEKYNKKFDIIVKYRADLTADTPLSFEEYKLPLQNNNVYIPSDFDWGGVNDQVAFGNEQSMERYCSCVDNLQKMCESNIYYHPETLLRKHLELSRMLTNRFEFRYRIFR